MVSTSQYIAIITFAILGILIPVLLPVVIHKKYIKIKLAPFFAGAAVFFLFANVLEGLMHIYFLKTNEYTKSLLENPWIYAVYGCTAAAVFEEGGRLIAFKFVLKKFRAPADGIAYGLGHGGIEFLLLGGVGAISTLVMAVMMDGGQLETLLSAKNIPASQIKEIKDSILSLDMMNVLMGLGERCMAMMMQIGLSMMVFYAVVTGKYKFYFFALAFHFAADFCAALSQKGVISPMWIVEVLLIPFAIAGVFIAINLYRKLKVNEEKLSDPLPLN